jgi:hypothetical protein
MLVNGRRFGKLSGGGEFWDLWLLEMQVGRSRAILFACLGEVLGVFGFWPWIRG